MATPRFFAAMLPGLRHGRDGEVVPVGKGAQGEGGRDAPTCQCCAQATHGVQPVGLQEICDQAREAQRDALLLVDAVSALSATLTAAEVASVACLHARKIARAKLVRVLHCTQDGKPTVLGSNPGTNHPSSRTIRNIETVIAVIRSNSPVMREGPNGRSLQLPIQVDGKPQGMLQLDFPTHAQHPSDRVVRLCSALAAQTGIALERAHRSDELARLAITDSLTGLDNRRQVLHDLRREIARARRSNEPLSVALLDLDHFKAFNDAHGHIEGDRQLRSFGRFLNRRTREVDAAGRYGGEEFLIILTNAGTADAFSVVDRLRRDWLRRSPVSFSAGVATWRATESWTDLIARADAALYNAKDGGRNRVEAADGELVSLASVEDGDSSDVWVPEDEGSSTDIPPLRPV